MSRDDWIASALAALLIPAIRLALRLRGFSWTAAKIESRLRRGTSHPTETTPEALAVAVGRVAARIPGTTCLPRSLALWFVMRRVGITAEHVIGASSDRAADGDFAHAWVEVDGHPMGEAPDVQVRFPAFPRSVSRDGVA